MGKRKFIKQQKTFYIGSQMTKTANRVIKNTGYLYAKMFISMFISLYTVRLILNSLGQTDFGIFQIVGGAVAMLGFFSASMASATQRFMSYFEGSRNKEKQKIIFNVSIVMHFFLSFIVGLFLVGAGYFFFHGILNIPAERVYSAKVIYTSLIFSTMFTVMTVPYDAVMNAHENMFYYSLVGLLQSFLTLGVAFVCVYTHYDKLIVYGILMAFIPIISLVIMRIYCHRKYEECIVNPKRYFDKNVMKDMTSFAGWNLLGTSSSMIGNYGQGILVNHFFGVVVNAAMGICRQIECQLLALNQNMQKALNPVIVKEEGANHREEMLRWSYVGCRFSFLLLAVFALPFVVVAPFVLQIWLKQVPAWTIIFVRIQLTRSMLEQMTLSFNTSLSATGNIKTANILVMVLYFFPLFIEYILFSYGFPPYWIYLTMLIVTITQTTLNLRLYHKYCSLEYQQYFKEVFFPLLLLSFATIAAAIIPYVFTDYGWMQTILSVTFAEIIFFVFSYFFVLRNKEKSILIEVYHKISKRAK